MPEKESIEVIRELKKGYLNVPIIAISGGGQVSARIHLDAAELFGVNAAFEKPINKEELLNAVKKALEFK